MQHDSFQKLTAVAILHRTFDETSVLPTNHVKSGALGQQVATDRSQVGMSCLSCHQTNRSRTDVLVALSEKTTVGNISISGGKDTIQDSVSGGKQIVLKSGRSCISRCC